MGGLAAPDQPRHSLSALAAEVIVGGWLFPLDLRARALPFGSATADYPSDSQIAAKPIGTIHVVD